MKVAGWTKRLIGLRKTFFHQKHQTSERCVASINKRLVDVHYVSIGQVERVDWAEENRTGTSNVRKMSSQHLSMHVSSSIYERLSNVRPLSFHWSSGRGWSRKSWAQCARQTRVIAHLGGHIVLARAYIAEPRCINVCQRLQCAATTYNNNSKIDLSIYSIPYLCLNVCQGLKSFEHP